MGFKRDLLRIMNHKGWIKGESYVKLKMEAIIMEALDISDQRVKDKWLGKAVMKWKKTVSGHVKDYEFSIGLLEQFGIVEIKYDGDIKFWHILKDKSDFPYMKGK